MGKRTENLGLYLPDSGELYFGDEMNRNFEIIDEAIARLTKLEGMKLAVRGKPSRMRLFWIRVRYLLGMRLTDDDAYDWLQARVKEKSP